ncbi:MAG: radical SAM family heme chaperone HemW [Pseudomonadota bacterium]
MQAIYIHWPFCQTKCPYCDFNSHRIGDIDTDIWQTALLSDLRAEAAYVKDLTGSMQAITSIFFGGGTPSTMPVSIVESLVGEIIRLWPKTQAPEITLEANPGTFDAQRFSAYRQAGVNRLSLGVQSLRDERLRFLGRTHDAKQARVALEYTMKIFENYSCDMIYATPGQTPQMWQEELNEMLSWHPKHLSLYQLMIEEGTHFAARVALDSLHPMSDDDMAPLYEMSCAMLTRCNLAHYEISNHALPGYECRHNLAYWRYDDYIGIGPGAYGKLRSDRPEMATQLRVRHRLPKRWVQAVHDGSGLAQDKLQHCDHRASLQDALMMGIRLGEGIDLQQLCTYYQRQDDLNPMLRSAKILQYEGLLTLAGTNLCIAPHARLRTNAILRYLMARGDE